MGWEEYILNCGWAVGRGNHTWVIFDIILADGVKLCYREGGVGYCGLYPFVFVFPSFSPPLEFIIVDRLLLFLFCFMSYDSILRVHSRVVFRLWHCQLCIIVTARHGFIFSFFLVLGVEGTCGYMYLMMK